MTMRFNKMFWFEFIEEYKKMTPLWDQRSVEFTNKLAKFKCYEILVKKVKKINRYADIDYVRCTIESLRSAYQREKNKIAKSIKKGKEIYKPTWCFYPKLKFLDLTTSTDKEVSKIKRKIIPKKNNSTSSISNTYTIASDKCEQMPRSNQDSTQDYPYILTEMYCDQYLSEQSVDYQPRPALTKENEKSALTGEMLTLIRNYFQRPVADEDHCDMMGKCFALKLKMVDRKQRHIIDKLMNEAFWEAEQGNLTVDHKVCNVHQSDSSHSSNQLPLKMHSTYTTDSSQCESPVTGDSQQLFNCDELMVKIEEPDT